MAEYSIPSKIHFYTDNATPEKDKIQKFVDVEQEAGSTQKVMKGSLVILIFLLLSVIILTFLTRDPRTVMDNDVTTWEFTILFLTQFALAILVFLRLVRWLRS